MERRYDRAVSLGFLVSQTGALTPTLQRRVDRAIDHYRQGRTHTLVMSGGRLELRTVHGRKRHEGLRGPQWYLRK